MENLKIKLKEFLQKIKSYDFNSLLALYIILPILLNLIITCLELKSVFKGFVFMFRSPYIFVANTMIILMTLSITLLVKKRIFFAGLISFVWLTMGVTNFILLCNRVTPFTACDLYMIDSVWEMIQKYFNWFQIIMLSLLIVAVLVGLVILFFKAPKINHTIKYGRCLVLIALICGATVGTIKLGTSTGVMDSQFKELSAAYRKNGFAYCFTNSLIDTGVSKPKDYSAESIAQIIAGDHSSITGDTAQKTPNIIIVQLESFFDVTALDGLVLSEDVLSNFRKYQKKDGGLFEVPVIGAGTSNTEFEVVTGMSIDDFGAGEYPYKTILLETTCESIAYNLKTYGYKTHVMHNHTGNFYERNKVYSNLGFENFQSVEYMQNIETTPMGWAKDAVLTDYIIEFLQSTPRQDLVYTISVQGHGKYVVEDGYTKHVSLEQTPTGKDDMHVQYEYYVNMLYEMDLFVEALVNTLSNFPEDTILVMYGDHLPSLEIENSDLNGRIMYQTDYFIWNNMGLQFNLGDIKANQISSMLMKKLGMTNGIINSFHQNHTGEEDFDESLAALEYDILYGDRLVYGGKNPYPATDIKMGLYEIKIHNILPDPTNPNTYCVVGENFTPYSKVFLNDEKVNTTFVNENTLYFQVEDDYKLVAGDIINVWQSSLSCTTDYKYNIIPMIKVDKDSSEDEE